MMFICLFADSNEQINTIHTLGKQLCVDRDNVLILATNFATSTKTRSINKLKRPQRTETVNGHTFHRLEGYVGTHCCIYGIRPCPHTLERFYRVR